jgi:hypothetical protein
LAFAPVLDVGKGRETNIMNAQTFNSEELHRRTLERRAVEAAIWGIAHCQRARDA